MAVLTFHEKRCRQQYRVGADPAVVTNGNVSRPNKNEHRGKATRHSLRDLNPPKTGEDSHELVIFLKSVRKKLNFRESLEAQDDPPRKRVKRDYVQCIGHLAIWDNREIFRKNPEPIYKSSQPCTVTPCAYEDEAPWALIEMDEPFRIKANDLLVPLPGNQNQNQSIRYVIGDNYTMEIKIIPTQSARHWPPMPILCKSEGSSSSGIARSTSGFMEGILVANYANLPVAPASEVPLSVSFDKEQRTFKTKYGFEIFARWEHPVRPLEQMNQIKKEPEKGITDSGLPWRTKEINGVQSKDGRRPQVTQPLEDLINEDNLSRSLKPKIAYHFADTIIKPGLSHIEFSDVVHFEGFRCPACNSRDFKSMKTLRFHLTTYHERYRFELERQEKDPISGTTTAAVFKIAFAEINRERAANHVKDERDFAWTAPHDPFNVDDFLDGDTTWVGIPPRKRKPPGQEVAGPSSPTALFKPTSLVRPINKLAKKRHKVPKARTRIETPLFRSVSHQVAPKGEAFSESDDEIDQTWLEELHSAKLNDLPKFSETSKALLTRFDAHLVQEQFPATRYLSDSLVRFTRANKDFLKDPAMLSEFSVMVSQLIENGWTNVQVLSGCMALVRGKQDATLKGQRRNVHKAAKAHALATEQSNSSLTHVEAEPEMPKQTPIGVCTTCSAVLRNDGEYVACSNTVRAFNISPTRFLTNF
ncbi:MAG: hypothetical protein Q9160_005187 [Pyrenula sp. 1 TL-2023]